MSNDKTIDGLAHLVHINQDAEAGLNEAATTIKNSELETLLSGYAKQHAKFGVELKAEIERLGGTVTDEKESGGGLHRAWMDLKSALFGESHHGILESCRDGEESAHIAYQDAADVNAVGKTHSLIDKQWKQIQGFRAHLGRLVAEVKDGVRFPINE